MRSIFSLGYKLLESLVNIFVLIQLVVHEIYQKQGMQIAHNSLIIVNGALFNKIPSLYHRICARPNSTSKIAHGVRTDQRLICYNNHKVYFIPISKQCGISTPLFMSMFGDLELGEMQVAAEQT